MWSDARSALSHGLIIPPEPIPGGTMQRYNATQPADVVKCIEVY